MTTHTPLLWRLASRLLINNGEHTRLLTWLWRRALNTPYSHLPDYMGRWYVLQPVKRPEDPGYIGSGWRYWLDKWHALLPFYIRFHFIQRADDDRNEHDHPWWFRSIILAEWYTEECEDEHGKHYRKYGPGDVNIKNPGDYHRITSVSPKCVLTLVIHGRRRKDSWGFKVDGKHVPWRKYLGLDN